MSFHTFIGGRRSRWRLTAFLVTILVTLIGTTLTPALATQTTQNDRRAQVDSDGDGDLDAPTAAQAAASAKVLGKPVEDLSKRTSGTRTFANANGTLTVQIAPLHDTWVRSGTTRIQGWSERLLIGRIRGESNQMPAGSYIRFPQAPFAALSHKTITKASLSVWQYESGSCSARKVNVLPLESPANENTTTFANRPHSIAGTPYEAVLSANKGRNGCPGTQGGNNGFVAVDVTAMARGWAVEELPNWGVQMSVPQSAIGDRTYERRFCSRNLSTHGGVCSDAKRRPVVTVTYLVNTPPEAAPAGTNGQECGYFLGVGNPTTVEAQGYLSDVDGDDVTPYFQWSAGEAVDPNGAEVAGDPVPMVDPTNFGSAPIPVVGSGTYSFRVRGKDSRGRFGPYSDSCSFIVDRSLPGNPTITGLPDVWEAGHTYDLTFTPGGDDPAKTTGYYFARWAGVPSTEPNFPADGPGNTHTYSFTLPDEPGLERIDLWAYNDNGISRIPFGMYFESF